MIEINEPPVDPEDARSMRPVSFPELDRTARLQPTQVLENAQPGRPVQRREQPQRPSRVEKMQGVYSTIEKAAAQGMARDEQAIRQKTEAISKFVSAAIEEAGGAVEIGAKIARGAKGAVELVARESWQVAQELTVRTGDVLEGIGRTAFKGAKWGAIGAAVLVTSPITILYTTGVGLVELGAHGVKKLSEGKQGTIELSHRGAAAVHAGLEAARLSGQQRQAEFQTRHDQRVENIRGKHVWNLLKGGRR